MMKIVVIDNYDSFVYNLVQYFGELGAEILVFRNDEISIKELSVLSFSGLVLSPGPGVPQKAGICESAVSILAGKIPILGVCLGHQAIGEVFGGKVINADRVMHGKVSLIYHDNKGILSGITSPFRATRYHSLILSSELPSSLSLSAWTDKGEVMGIKHNEYPIFGVQFHPESIFTPFGKDILKNFLNLIWEEKND